ncbi:type I restriction-modification system subunit M [Candidatus Gracilibacteria bacterium]|nr:type I restriction-modification system subunit M [Candidatus Gracilibacteria bacterium]
MSNFNEKVSFIWDLADLLRGPYKRSEYQDVILPFVVLKRFDSVLSDTKKQVVEKYNFAAESKIENFDHLLRTTSKNSFYNYSKYDFESLLQDPEHIEQNLLHYIDSFSKNVYDIFENFEIKKQIEKLAKSNILFKLVKKFNSTDIDLHPSKVDNHEMGLIFEELVRKFAESSNEEAGEHFTPRDVIDLMTHLMFIEDKDDIKKDHTIKRIYDPACGTGGMLTNAKTYIKEKINPKADIVLYGQEINPKTFAVSKSDMLLKGEESGNIRGPFSTLGNDLFPNEKFDYILSNPPYGTKWEADEDFVKKEAELGENGRFGAGLPRINDGQLLFLQHMISKMKTNGEKSRISVITNGSPLFTGDAGSGESDIRKFLIESDYLEAIIALPGQLFYNTGIGTYIWILSNQKKKQRIGKIQLIDGTNFWQKMRKSLGEKRRELHPVEHQQKLIDLYHNFEETEFSKIFKNEEFGYTKVVVERPLQLNFQINEERIENLYSISTFSKLSESTQKDITKKEQEIEAGIQLQNDIITSLKIIGEILSQDYEDFSKKVNNALEKNNLKPVFINQIIMALSEHDETAPFILDKKGNKQANTALRDSEKIRLDQDIEEYFKKEVLPYYPDAWMDRSKDKVGYEINFTKYFYKYEPPRSLEDIEADIFKITAEIDELVKEEL